MPLEFADFAYLYDESPKGEDEQRADFQIVADLLECIVRLFWDDSSGPNPLGITLDGDSLQLVTDIDSRPPQISNIFNNAAIDEAVRKKDS